jgi:acyl-coenzyme A thioesterase PaaI-like protein
MPPLSHHELCFGCGLANLFGLHLELERRDDGWVAGRLFVKQDLQGPDGRSHPGVLAAALLEAMSLAGDAIPGELELSLLGSAPVGGWVRVEASPDGSRAAAFSGENAGRPALARARARA